MFSIDWPLTDEDRAQACGLAMINAERHCKLPTNHTAPIRVRAKRILDRAHAHRLEPRLYSLAYQIANWEG